MKVKLLDHLKKMGAKNIMFEYRLTDDGDDSIDKIQVDSMSSSFIDILDHDRIIDTITEISNEYIENTEREYKIDERWNASGCITIDLVSCIVTHSCSLYWESEEETQTITNVIKLPEELLGKIPIEFTIHYSGGGDDGGIDDIEFDGEFPEFKEYMNKSAWNFIPEEADFNNAGSSGIIECKSLGIEVTCTAQHNQNYDNDKKINIPTKYESMNIEVEI